ncbi:MAG: c-type cytochrome, partial [Planctomycetota bacterium]|nr:c-type cytochrome [Planctomycetota bacterium]
MPATEQNWRNIRLLHILFAVSSIVMLVTTIWMMAVDHNRPWKDSQRKFQTVEAWTAQSRIDEQDSADYAKRLQFLQDQVEATKVQPPDLTVANEFVAVAAKAEEDREAVEDLKKDLVDMPATGTLDEAQKNRRITMLKRMKDIVQRSRYRETNLANDVKVTRAGLDEARAKIEIAISHGDSSDPRAEAELEKKRKKFDEIQQRLEGPPAAKPADTSSPAVADPKAVPKKGLIADYQTAKLHRETLERLFKKVTAPEDAAAKELADHRTKLEQLHAALLDRQPRFGKRILELPIIDAFGSPLRIDQIWLPQLTLNNNFRDVARFDRCNTCHQAMDKTAPGSAIEPGYPQQQTFTLTLATPSEQPQSGDVSADAAEDASEFERLNNELRRVYGFQLAEVGLLHASNATISVVLPETLAARANLASGDILKSVNQATIRDKSDAFVALLESPTWGQPLSVEVQRGLPHPFSTHPRLDLFVGSLSPHPMGKFGCTICHQGQGSATSFEWASHSPDSPTEAARWSQELGWFNNHHWILPMLPTRFVESSCLKCHHEVTELAASAKFPEAPAPKLTKGYDLIQSYGCYGCHEINGYDGPNKRVGPDLRNEPNYFAAALQLLADPKFSTLGPQAVELAKVVSQKPEDEKARHDLQEIVSENLSTGKSELLPNASQLAALLKDVEAPGTLRKVGPSLRFVASKDSFEFLYDWIENPHRFRPTTKMPRFFGLWDHLEGKGLHQAEEFEPIEIRAITNYLLGASQSFEYVKPWEGVTMEPSAERGKKVFEIRGCLACHTHSDFPVGKANQGPDLSRMGAKLSSNPDGAKWLYSWVREPNRYHSRTVMPNTFLEPIKSADGTSDPAADVTAFLMSSTQDWKPRNVDRNLKPEEVQSLERLAQLHLEAKFSESQAAEFLKKGFPTELA